MSYNFMLHGFANSDFILHFEACNVSMRYCLYTYTIKFLQF